MEHYDLCVIGGGPAGYAAAMRAIDLGKRVLLVERDRIGGTGIYNGALASKTLWEIAQRVSSTNDLMRTRGREPFRLSWEEISKHAERGDLRTQVPLRLPHATAGANGRKASSLFTP